MGFGPVPQQANQTNCWSLHRWWNLQIRLHDNFIHTVDPTVFADTPDLDILDLSNNEITQLSRNLFKGTRLRDLYLNNNSLSSLREGIFEGLRRPVLVTLIDNPLQCNSNLCWLWKQYEAGALFCTHSMGCSDGSHWYKRMLKPSCLRVLHQFICGNLRFICEVLRQFVCEVLLLVYVGNYAKACSIYNVCCYTIMSCIVG